MSLGTDRGYQWYRRRAEGLRLCQIPAVV